MLGADMDSNASKNIYFKPSWRTTEQEEQQDFLSEKQSLDELPQPNSNSKLAAGSWLTVNQCRGTATSDQSPRRTEAGETEVICPSTGSVRARRRTGSFLALSTAQDAQLAASLVYKATEPHSHRSPFQTCCKISPRIYGKAIGTLNWGSVTVQGSGI